MFNGRKREPVRWVGNERGIAPDENWNSLRREDIDLGDAAARASDPDRDLWAPVECDTTLYDHNWFWNPRNEAKRKSLDHLLHVFVKSAGNGSILLLNSNPDTSGRIPAGDVTRHAEFGTAIERNFGRPSGPTSAPVVGHTASSKVAAPGVINCADIWEDCRRGHRIRGFVVEGRCGQDWIPLATGTAATRNHGWNSTSAARARSPAPQCPSWLTALGNAGSNTGTMPANRLNSRQPQRVLIASPVGLNSWALGGSGAVDLVWSRRSVSSPDGE